MKKTKTRQKRGLAEAADWFVRVSRTSVSAEALHEFAAWRKRSKNADAYRAVETAWQAVAALKGDQEMLAEAATALGRATAVAGQVSAAR